MDWLFIGGAAGALSLLAGRGLYRRAHQESAAKSAGLAPIDDLTHLPVALQNTALWMMADGGFEQRVVHGQLSRPTGDVEITAFDLETLRERRGEWAWLPVEPPFRIAATVSVAVCRVARAFPHALMKHAGVGDELRDDDLADRATKITKLARDGLRLPRSYASELPNFGTKPTMDVPDGWRGYSHALYPRLPLPARRDLVVELLADLIVVYPAARVVAGPDAFADLTELALSITDIVLEATPQLSPRGVEP